MYEYDPVNVAIEHLYTCDLSLFLQQGNDDFSEGSMCAVNQITQIQI